MLSRVRDDWGALLVEYGSDDHLFGLSFGPGGAVYRDERATEGQGKDIVAMVECADDPVKDHPVSVGVFYDQTLVVLFSDPFLCAFFAAYVLVTNVIARASQPLLGMVVSQVYKHIVGDGSLAREAERHMQLAGTGILLVALGDVGPEPMAEEVRGGRLLQHEAERGLVAVGDPDAQILPFSRRHFAHIKF